MFLMITLTGGRVMDVDVNIFEWISGAGIWWITDDAVKHELADNEVARVELYPSREAALVDGADVRDYPGWE